MVCLICGALFLRTDGKQTRSDVKEVSRYYFFLSLGCFPRAAFFDKRRQKGKKIPLCFYCLLKLILCLASVHRFLVRRPRLPLHIAPTRHDAAGPSRRCCSYSIGRSLSAQSTQTYSVQHQTHTVMPKKVSLNSRRAQHVLPACFLLPSDPTALLGLAVPIVD